MFCLRKPANVFVLGVLYVLSLVNCDLLSDQFNPQGITPSTLSKEILQCMVCRAMVDEVEVSIDRVSPHQKVEVGSFRLDASGNIKQAAVPYARSTLHLSEVMDKVCDAFNDYVLAQYKSSGRPTLFRITSHDGKMNPEMADVDITPDLEGNKKFSHYCHNLVEDHEDEIISIFAKNETNPHRKVCVTLAGLCPTESEDNEEEEAGSDSEPYHFEHEDF